MDVTREEFYRAVDELKTDHQTMRLSVESLRVEITALALTLALLRHDLELLKQTKRDYREWIAMSVIGAIIAAVDYLIHRLTRP